MMKELACAKSFITAFLKAQLKWLNLRMIVEVRGRLVAACGGGKLARKYGSARRCTENASRVSVRGDLVVSSFTS